MSVNLLRASTLSLAAALVFSLAACEYLEPQADTGSSQTATAGKTGGFIRSADYNAAKNRGQRSGNLAKEASGNRAGAKDAVKDVAWLPGGDRSTKRDASRGNTGGFNNNAGRSPSANRANGVMQHSMAFPTGDRRTSAILLEKVVPAEVALGQSFNYEIKVTNLTSMALHGVKVTDAIHSDFELIGSEPKMLSRKDGQITWDLQDLAPRSVQRIVVNAKASKLETVKTCTSVSYATHVCSAINVVKPALLLTMTQPEEVLICDEIPVVFQVRNSGTGLARDVRVQAALPPGLTTKNGRSTVTLNAGTLGAGQSRRVSIRAKASQPGRYVTKANASSSNGIKTDVITKITNVRQPALKVTAKNPGKLFLGREGTFEFTVSNVGDITATRTEVTATLPTGVRFLGASNQGKASSGRVVWSLGALAPKASKTVTMRLKSDRAGECATTATARAYCAKVGVATAKSKMIGIPAILMEVVDVDDPIVVGNKETYLVTITNQGSAPGHDIKIVCILDDGMKCESAGGATKGKIDGKMITLEPLGVLAAKEKAVWRIVVVGTKEGDRRFTVKLTSRELTRPVDETEATTFYK